ncbi:AAA family ATPase [Rhizobium laguerreae]|uniref:ATP-dependent nuclease n=1 Tax=Rhizobium laguerreae TaxID=1076926 RepID=UPI001C914674|nr:AAA family ATPase [Rhizobium laguerreae]MBY3544788.1 AAA family ATPase [Rhizobium laguerreae]MBY3549245.1 AAA family ATPase [Rhizobium laguerreae]
MYLATLKVTNFRKLSSVSLDFNDGLNIIVGPNNVGKSAVVDALRSLLAGADDPYPRLMIDDIHSPKGGQRQGSILFSFTFKGLTLEDEADLLPALKIGEDKKIEAVLSVRYGDPDKSGRLKVKRWCGEHEETSLTSDILENLRSVYLQPLRDAGQLLKPGRSSQLARLFHLLTDEDGRQQINDALTKLDSDLKKQGPLIDTHKAISTRHENMIGVQLRQALELGLSGTDFQRLAARLSLLVDNFEIEQNGLGFNNLIFMAVVLSEMAMNPDAAFRGLIVEEPEAHLHPQLQTVLLKYLSDIKATKDDKPVQVFVTSHSPNFASIAPLDTITCLVETGGTIQAFAPRTIKFDKGKKEKLARYLDVTRAELFFARRIIFVEGAAELLMVTTLAHSAGYDLRQHGVSVVSVEGLNFDSFLPLFGETALRVRVAVITDADPEKIVVAGSEPVPHYPALDEVITVSDNTSKMKKSEDSFVKIFHGVKTFEYDLALLEDNRPTMIDALKEIHPRIATALEAELASKATDQEKATALFRGMFERAEGNVQKGKFGQSLAAKITDEKKAVKVPAYIINAIEHVCGNEAGQ